MEDRLFELMMKKKQLTIGDRYWLKRVYLPKLCSARKTYMSSGGTYESWELKMIVNIGRLLRKLDE